MQISGVSSGVAVQQPNMPAEATANAAAAAPRNAQQGLDPSMAKPVEIGKGENINTMV